MLIKDESPIHWQRRITMLQRLLLATALLLGTASGAFSQAPDLSTPDAHVKLAVLACFEKMDLLHPEQGPAIAKFKAALMKGMENPLEDVRQYSLAVLGATKGIPEEDQKRAVLQGLVDLGHKVRRIALGNVSYKKLNDPEIIAAAIALTAAWPKDLYLAIEALGDAAPTDPRAVKV